MHTYNILVEFADGSERKVAVRTEVDLSNADEDMLASDIEACLIEQHGIDSDGAPHEYMVHWEYN